MKLGSYREELTEISERMDGLNSSNEKESPFGGINHLSMVFIY